MKKALIAVIALTAVTAQAGSYGNWVQVASSDSNNFYYRSDSLSWDGRTVGFWSSVRSKNGKEGNVNYIKINCATGQWHLTTESGSTGSWKLIQPDSVTEIIAGKLCK